MAPNVFALSRASTVCARAARGLIFQTFAALVHHMLYFAYGSNMLQTRIEERLGACRRVVAGWLGGHTLRFHKSGGDGSGKCDCFATRAEHDVLHGVVYELSSGQAERLDAIEGSGYTRWAKEIRHGTGCLEVFAYFARPQHIDTDLLPFCWYKGLVLAGAVRAGLPEDYVGEIRAVTVLQDPDHSRRTHNESLFEAGAI